MKMCYQGLVSLIRRTIGMPATGAEIGVWKGHTVSILHNFFPTCHLTLVDPWQPFASENGIVLDEIGWQAVYEEAVQNIANSGGPSLTCVMTSAEAAAQTPDKSLDFVFIDADHRYESVCEDIQLWLPKARQLICGHDYNGKQDKAGVFGVKRAVDEAFGTDNVIVRRGLIWGYKIPQFPATEVLDCGCTVNRGWRCPMHGAP